MNANGVTVNYLIHFWDKAGHRNGEILDTPRFQTEDQILDFLEYVRFVVSHFKGQVQYYTIWTEPDACGGSNIKCIEPNDYINLLTRTIPVIHEEDPAAKVSLGPVVLYFAQDYLNTILNSDVRMAVKYQARFFIIHLGMDIGVSWPIEGTPYALGYRTKANLNTLMNGSRPASIPATITSEAANIASYGFSLPNGDQLFALWTDGVAVDHDTGISATLTFTGVSDISVTGIDVLQGFEQELIASEEGGNLVIRDLLVKDYPIILRLSPTRYVFLPVVLKGHSR